MCTTLGMFIDILLPKQWHATSFKRFSTLIMSGQTNSTIQLAAFFCGISTIVGTQNEHLHLSHEPLNLM